MKIFNLILLVAMCLSSSLVMAASKKDASEVCAAAESMRQQAAKVKMEWTTTAKLIKIGQAALKRGEFTKAVDACSQAKFQGEASVKQAAIEAKAWKARMPN